MYINGFVVPVPNGNKAEYKVVAEILGHRHKMMADPRMKEIGESMPFDAKRMIFGGFEPLVVRGA